MPVGLCPFAVKSCWGWGLQLVLVWEGCPDAVPVNVLRAGCWTVTNCLIFATPVYWWERGRSFSFCFSTSICLLFTRWPFFPDSLIDGCCGQKARAVQDVPHPHFTSKPDVMEWAKRDYLRCLSMVRVLIDECVHLGSLRIKPRGRLNYIIKLADNRNASGKAGVLPAGKFPDLFPKQSF